MTTTDPANASCRPAASLRERSAASADATSDDDQQLADFDADVEREQRPAERARRQIHLAQHVGEAEAVDEAERERDPGAHVAAAADQQVVGADVDDAERDGRLDDPRRRLTMLSAASDSVMLCATVNAVTTTASCRIVPPSSSRPTRNSR